eukprot:6114888-Amphidinium_carterae.2
MTMIRALYGSELSGLACACSFPSAYCSSRRARKADCKMARAAELELALKGGVQADPQLLPPRPKSGKRLPSEGGAKDAFGTLSSWKHPLGRR